MHYMWFVNCCFIGLQYAYQSLNVLWCVVIFLVISFVCSCDVLDESSHSHSLKNINNIGQNKASTNFSSLLRLRL